MKTEQDASVLADADDLFVLDIERLLVAVDGTEHRQEIHAQLAAQLAAVKTSIRGGLNPDQFARAEAYRLALESAAKVIEETRPRPIGANT